MTGTAIMSPDGVYRYSLTRQLSSRPGRLKHCTWIMLNPSTATAEIDDPTIRRCIGFATSWECHALTVVNLFALRATDPTELAAHADPVGPENDGYIITAANLGGIVVAAWGVHGILHGRDRVVRDLMKRYGHELRCLGTTQGGFPRHPLYVKGDTQLVLL
jgi:hypothetical protein